MEASKDNNNILLSSDSQVFDKTLCIICQQDAGKLTKSENGCLNVRWAASVRNDVVYSRIITLNTSELFYYHVSNSCYRSYTNKEKVSRFLKRKNDEGNSEKHVGNSETECSNFLANEPSRYVNKEQKQSNGICVICNSLSFHDSKVSKFTEIKRAENFLNIISFYNDEISARCVSIKNPNDVLTQELCFHKNCLRTVEKKYERETKVDEDEVTFNSEATLFDESFYNFQSLLDEQTLNSSQSTIDEELITNTFSQKGEAIAHVMTYIIPRVKKGEVFSLSNARDEISKIINSEIIVTNKDVKKCLLKNFNEDIEFLIPSDKKQPTLFYSSQMSFDEIILRLQPMNIIKESASLIKDSLNKVDFDLEDKFFDVSNLQSSWENMEIPNELVTFFSELFNVQKRNLRDMQEQSKCAKTMVNKTLKIKTLFQIMYYILQNGKLKTPLHIMNSITVYNTCKSKSLIQSLNHLGLSISYDELLKCKTALALFTIESGSHGVSIPSNFTKNKFTKGAFDNFDHNEDTTSGLNSTHDTVCVLFQESSNTILQKPKTSNTTVNKESKSLSELLECQKLQLFYKPTSKIILSSKFTSDGFAVSPDMYIVLRKQDFVWYLCRMDVSNASLSEKTTQIIPTWSAFNSIVIEDNRKFQNVGFLPIIPHPVTEFSTVYTAMCNFNNVLKQLDQEYFPLFCDEGVYHIARHIQLLREKEFENITLMLGSFHMTKILLSCIGKYLKESGADHMFIELGLFGINAVDQVLNGSHYARSVKGFFMLGEALQRMQLEVFFKQSNIDDYDNDLSTITALQDTLSEENFAESRALFSNFCQNCDGVIRDFEQFVLQRSRESPLFKYWTNVLILIQLLRDMIRADRTGDWLLHVETTKKLLPIFYIFDRTNYLRWGSMYLQDILKLPHNKKELYDEFMLGQFTFKKSNLPCTSVGTDQGLEQTINRSQKSSSGIIGNTKRKEYVAAWNLNYHELLAVKNYYREVTNVTLDNCELQVHHEFSKTITERSEEDVDKIIHFILSHLNPFKNGEEPLRNIITQQLVADESVEPLLNVFQDSCDGYKEFFYERFVEKTKSLSDTIKKVKLPNFVDNAENKSNRNTSTTVTKENKLAQRVVDLAKERNYDLKKLFTYELTSKNMLFNEDGSLKKEKNKSDLVKILESHLLLESYEELNDFNDFTVIIDVMLKCRRIQWKNLQTFNDFAFSFCNSITIAKSSGIKRIDFIFDSYVEKSMKSDERQGRYKDRPINVHCINEKVPLPKQENLFWGSKSNKILLQNFLREYILENSSNFWPGKQIICSATNQIPCQCNNSEEENALIFLQKPEIEEADSRIIIHIYHACVNEIKKILVLSSDTDVFVLLLHYFATFQENGLKELWIEFGAAAKKRILPLHILAKNRGPLCAVLPALHHLTGADYTSKVGTKHSALQANPEIYLKSFALDISEVGIKNSIDCAEQYLIKVLRKTNKSLTFDDLRYCAYRSGSQMLISELPPSSASIHLHILRSFIATYKQINLLNENNITLDPTNFGYYEDEDCLLPIKVKNLFPSVDDLLPSCNCKNCTKCTCVNHGFSCTSLCKCQINDSCKNPYN